MPPCVMRAFIHPARWYVLTLNRSFSFQLQNISTSKGAGDEIHVLHALPCAAYQETDVALFSLSPEQYPAHDT